jgi:polysaccharide biosynthesis transport protein
MQEKLAEKIYVDVATRYEQARLQVAGRSAQLQVVDRALGPEAPVSPRIAVNVSAAVVLTFSAIATLIVSIVAVRRAIRPVSIKP